MLNMVQLIGNVGKDPEIRTMNSGGRLANLSVATSESWKDKATGERKEKTEWHRIVVWNENIVNVIEKYVSKGDRIYLQGKIETRKYTDQSGAERYTTEIVLKGFDCALKLMGGKRSEGDGQSGQYDGGSSPQTSKFTPRDDLEDDIPF